LAITEVTVTGTPGNVESPVVMTSGGIVMVAWLSVVSVVETGVEKVDSGISVAVLAGTPRPVEDTVTEADGDRVTDDELFDTVMEALLGAAGVTGETTLGDVRTPEAVEGGSEDVEVEMGVEEVTSTPDELGEVGGGEDVMEVFVISDMSNARRFVLEEKLLVGARLAEGLAGGSAHNVVELNRIVVVFVPFVWPNLADGSEAFVRDTPGLGALDGDEIDLAESVPLTSTT
jgi:hypothetical protein